MKRSTCCPPAAVLLSALLAATPASFASEAQCHVAPAGTPAHQALHQAMAHGRFITYEPTSVVIANGRHVQDADADSIREDLALVRTQFDALLTYEAGNGLEAIPEVAESLGFRAMMIGVWSPEDPAEVALAIKVARAHPNLVVGLILGNETLYRGQHTPDSLARVIAGVRDQAPELMLATSEPFDYYQGAAAAELRAQSDLLLPNIHPVYAEWFRPGEGEKRAAEMVRNVVGDLRGEFCGPILVKETGEPTGHADEGYSEGNQAAFWRELRRVMWPAEDVAFAYFSAFDLPWRALDGGLESEAHWGLFDEARRAKLAVAEIEPQPLAELAAR